MTITPTLFTLLHILVFVYWLGGDLGAFYTSRFLRQTDRPVGERMLALNVLNNIDMAPRTALILALPTGVALAWGKGWIAWPGSSVAVIAVLSLAWLALAWGVHLKHGAGAEGFRKADMAIRYIVLIALAAMGIAAIAGAVILPLFIALKMLLLAGCIMLGLMVRKVLAPLPQAIGTMLSSGPTAGSDAALDGCLARARPLVLAIWVLIIAAASLGIATPA